MQIKHILISIFVVCGLGRSLFSMNLFGGNKPKTGKEIIGRVASNPLLQKTTCAVRAKGDQPIILTYEGELQEEAADLSQLLTNLKGNLNALSRALAK